MIRSSGLSGWMEIPWTYIHFSQARDQLKLQVQKKLRCKVLHDCMSTKFRHFNSLSIFILTYFLNSVYRRLTWLVVTSPTSSWLASMVTSVIVSSTQAPSAPGLLRLTFVISLGLSEIPSREQFSQTLSGECCEQRDIPGHRAKREPHECCSLRLVRICSLW